MIGQDYPYQVTTIENGEAIVRDETVSLRDAYEVMRMYARAGITTCINTISRSHSSPLVAVADATREWPGGPLDGADRYGVEAEL